MNVAYCNDELWHVASAHWVLVSTCTTRRRVVRLRLWNPVPNLRAPSPSLRYPLAARRRVEGQPEAFPEEELQAAHPAADVAGTAGVAPAASPSAPCGEPADDSQHVQPGSPEARGALLSGKRRPSEGRRENCRAREQFNARDDQSCPWRDSGGSCIPFEAMSSTEAMLPGVWGCDWPGSDVVPPLSLRHRKALPTGTWPKPRAELEGSASALR